MSTILLEPRYSMSKAAKLVGVHIATMWRWYLHGVRGHKLPARLVGGRRYVLAADLDAFLNAIDSGPRARDATVDRRADEAGKLLDVIGVGVHRQTSRDHDSIGTAKTAVRPRRQIAANKKLDDAGIS